MNSIPPELTEDVIQEPLEKVKPLSVIRVLNVDDEPNHLEFAKLFIEEIDPSIQVESVSSPEEAVRRLQERSCDCVVSDYQMPGMDGIELARMIRETSDIPFVIYTGRGSEEVAEAAFAAGVDDYLRKELDPAHYQVLAKRIRTVVEKHRAEKSLMESERRYKSLVEESRDGILVFTDGVLVFANQQAAVLHGCDSVEELMKIGPNNILHPDDRDYVEERSLARQSGDDIPPVTEFRVVLQDGTLRELQSSSSLITYEGKPSTLAFVRDITEQKRIEEELRESEEKFRNLAENSPNMVFINMKGRVVYANEKCEKIMEYKREEFYSHDFDFLSLIAPEYLDKVKSIFSRHMRGEEVAPYEYALLTKNGNRIPVIITTTMIRYEGDLAILGIVTDLTNVKSLEEKHERQNDSLSKQEDRLAALHSSAIELAKTNTLENLIKVTLEAMRRSLGFEVASFLMVEDGHLVTVALEGAEMKGLKLPIDGPGITVKVARLGRTINVPDTRSEPDFVEGSIHALSELAVPVKVRGSVRAVLNVESIRLNTYDDNDQRLLETLAMHVASALECLEQIESLEKQVEEKTRELLDVERMVTAGRVASMVGHDLRGPLQTIKNSLYLLGRQSKKPEEYLKTAEIAVERAVQLLEELRHRTRDSPPNLSITDLSELITNAVNEAQIPGSIDVTLELDDGLEAVSLDPLKMRRVLDNLISNAVEAMPKGGSIVVSAKTVDDDVHIGVEDTGIGIPEEKMPNLFKPFHTTKEGGLGLGLAYCRRAVEAHGGSISVDSEEGRGTTFTIRIPISHTK